MDMTDVNKGLGTIDAELSKKKALNINTQMTNNKYSKNADEQPVTYTFTQNNYSPKSLSSLEIYRQTKNQFAMLKGVQSRYYDQVV